MQVSIDGNSPVKIPDDLVYEWIELRKRLVIIKDTIQEIFDKAKQSK